MAVLVLHFCARAFSSCGKRGPLFIMVRGPLTITASLVAEHRLQTRRLSNCGSRAQLHPRHVGSSQTRARTRVPCIGRQILNHCATWEAPASYLLNTLAFGSLYHPIRSLDHLLETPSEQTTWRSHAMRRESETTWRGTEDQLSQQSVEPPDDSGYSHCLTVNSLETPNEASSKTTQLCPVNLQNQEK